MSVGLANPAGALALVAVAALVLLHLHGRRRRVVRVATLFLWRQLPASPLERRRRLRPDLLFLLQLALLLALIGGLVRPYLVHTTGPGAGTSLLLVMDVSASMQAREAEGTRFALALRRARALVDAGGATTMILAAADRPHIVLRWTADRARILERLEALEPLDVPGDLPTAVALALGEAQARPGTHVAVLTDLPPGAAGLAGDDLAAVDFVQVGATDDNLAVAGLVVDRPPFPGAGPASATVVVRNYAHRARRTVLEARIGDVLWTRRDLEVAPRASEPVLLLDPPADGVLEVSLASDDALPVDDHAFAWIGSPAALDLVAVTDDDASARALRTLAAAIPGTRLELVRRAAAGAAALGPPRVAVLDGWLPSTLPVGASALIVGPPPGATPCASAGVVESAAVVDWEDDHRLLAGIGGLQALEVERARRLESLPWMAPVVLAASRQAAFPLLAAGDHDGRRVACLGAPLDDALASDDGLPLLVLVLGTLRWLAEAQAEPALVVQTGVPALASAALAAESADAGLRFAGDPPAVVADRVGVHRIGDHLVLASLFDDRESDIGREGAGELTATAHLEARTVPPRRREIGRWLYLVAAGLLGLEWLAWRFRGDA